MATSIKYQINANETNVTLLHKDSSYNDFKVWRFRMKNVLEEHNYWEATSEVNSECASWKEKNKNAKKILSRALHDDLVLDMIDMETAKDVWDTVVQKFCVSDEQPLEINAMSRKLEVSETSSTEAFLLAEKDEEWEKALDAFIEEVNNMPSRADEIGSNQDVLNKLKNKMSTIYEENSLFEKIANILETISSKIKQGSTAALKISATFGQILIKLAGNMTYPGSTVQMMMTLSNLCKFAPSAFLLEEEGIVGFFVSHVVQSGPYAVLAIIGLGALFMFCPNILRNETFQKHMNAVVEFCVKLPVYSAAREHISAAAEILKNVTNWCIKQISEGWSSTTEKALLVLEAIRPSKIGKLLTDVNGEIKKALLSILKFISDSGERLSQAATIALLRIVRSVDGVVDLIKDYAEQLCARTLQGVVKVWERMAEGCAVLEDLVSWFEYNIVRNIADTVVVVSAFAVAISVVYYAARNISSSCTIM